MTEQQIVTTAIERHARPSAAFAEREAEAVWLLQQAARVFAGHVVQATSMGVEDMVVSDLIVRHGLDIPMDTLDTGALHPQTLELIDRAQTHWGRPITVWRPAADAVAAFVDEHGPRAMYASVDLRKACCAVRKLEPLSRMLAGRAAWITGLRRQQSEHRQQVAGRVVDGDGRVKFSPLADWELGDVWHYVAEHGVPYNPLHDQFFPSIGCAPCTRAISLGEDIRAGRWWWEQGDTKECGLHAAPATTEPTKKGASA